MNENQHVGKVGNAYARTGNTHAGKNVWPACRRALTYVYPWKAPQFARLRFRFSCRESYEFLPHIRHDGILPSKTAETLPHKSAGPQDDLFIC